MSSPVDFMSLPVDLGSILVDSMSPAVDLMSVCLAYAFSIAADATHFKTAIYGESASLESAIADLEVAF